MQVYVAFSCLMSAKCDPCRSSILHLELPQGPKHCAAGGGASRVRACFGPVVLGRISPSLHQALFGQASLSSLTGLAAVAVVLFTFVSGMHIEGKVFHRSRRAET